MGIFDWKHWLVILLVVILVFGTRRLKTIGSDLGDAIKGFRQSMAQVENDDALTGETPKDKRPVEHSSHS